MSFSPFRAFQLNLSAIKNLQLSVRQKPKQLSVPNKLHKTNALNFLSKNEMELSAGEIPTGTIQENQKARS